MMGPANKDDPPTAAITRGAENDRDEGAQSTDDIDPPRGHEQYDRDGPDRGVAQRGARTSKPSTSPGTGLFVSPELAPGIRVYQIAVRRSTTWSGQIPSRRPRTWVPRSPITPSPTASG